MSDGAKACMSDKEISFAIQLKESGYDMPVYIIKYCNNPLTKEFFKRIKLITIMNGNIFQPIKELQLNFKIV